MDFIKKQPKMAYDIQTLHERLNDGGAMAKWVKLQTLHRNQFV